MDLSASGLLASLLIGSIGTGLFLYGKKAVRIPQLVCGLVLMIFPFFVSGALTMLGLAAVLLVGLWGLVRAGM